ncbi:PREDICTED: ubl carboxyl-terminal hydrolase 18-like [Lepidothrix coronata]|uniref:Ubl carboxyl-terminal hydrolase 18-like n=1 Tax=Lepidothrix coronata TaxID=321398 RepID=A0A6J0HZW6_9PASS|nr:PREDICTED: ubl carboxyl-terminal hydrolase 18-like [Lepidothrix coronata]
MGQNSGHQERDKKPELALSETMEAEAEVQSNKDEAKELKAKERRLTSVFGVADLKNGAIGLYNLGQSCCLNSLLQVFLMNIHFTGILRRITVPPCAAQRRSNVPYQMLLLLEEMQRGKRKAVRPTELACCLSAHRVECKQRCLMPTSACKPGAITIAARKNGEDCLQYFFHPEELTGQNMCFCQQCGMKTPFLKSMKLVYLPQTLTIHLKRFCFEKSSYAHKLSHYLPFPRDLDFNGVLTENQCQADVNEKATWQYGLFAVVAHSGSASCGHYCAYIQSLTECKWYCFNDSQVCQVSWDDVKCTYGHSNLHWGETAYLLIYMKKHPQQPYPGLSECLGKL